MKKKYLIILIVLILLIIFVSLSIVLGQYIFTCIDYVPRITEISNSDMENVIHNGINKGMHLETENL